MIAAAAVLALALALCVVVSCLTFGVPLARWIIAWVRVWTLCASFGIFDSHRMAARAARETSGHRTAPPERGSVWPSLRTVGGLPERYRIVGRINQHGRDHDGFTAEVEHYTGRPWTLHRRDGSRVLELRQAPAWPEIPAHPEPAYLAPWVLPVGDTAMGPALWDVTAAYHALVVARTGWRKSSFAVWLAGYARGMRHWTVTVVDPERQGPRDWLAALQVQADRLAELSPDVTPLRRTLLVIDEFDDVMAPTTARDDDHATRARCRALVWELLRHGGKRGLHVLALAQDPRAKALGPGVRSKFAARAAGWLDLAEYQLVLNRTPGHDRDGPPGRGWWSVPGVKPEWTQFHARPTQHDTKPDPYDEGPPTTRVTRIYGAIGDRPRRQ